MEGSFAARLAGKNGHSAAVKDSFQTRGAMIMEVAEVIRPVLQEWLREWRNEHNMPIRPERVRAIALNVAQDIVRQAA